MLASHATAAVVLGAAATFALDLHALGAAYERGRGAAAPTAVSAPPEVPDRRPRRAAPAERRRRPAPARPTARPGPARQRVSVATARAVPVRAPRPARPPAPAGPTSWGELNRAIARIPSYDGRGVRWVVLAHDGYWGTVDWSVSTIYVGPGVPIHRLYDVAVHEWSHLLSSRPYPDVPAALTAMNRYFGGTGTTGAERAADCMAILQGAAWTNYTDCRDPRWRTGAARLLRGRPV